MLQFIEVKTADRRFRYLANTQNASLLANIQKAIDQVPGGHDSIESVNVFQCDDKSEVFEIIDVDDIE